MRISVMQSKIEERGALLMSEGEVARRLPFENVHCAAAGEGEDRVYDAKPPVMH